MNEKIFQHEMEGLTYTRVDDYLIPNLIVEEPAEVRGFMGKYADLRRDYLKEHRPILWMVLVNTGKLVDHLRDTENTANARLQTLMPKFIKAAGITEELKARDPMRWVGLMNTCKAQAEEIIFEELIYT